MAKNTFPTKEEFKHFYDVEDITGCWNWNRGFCLTTGYGQYMINYKNYNSHRLSYEVYYGEIPSGLCVLHKCDNRACVNPAHLFLGTRGQNNTDRHKKGRSCVGEAHPLSKLTEQQVKEIRESTLSSRRIAKLYGVAPTLIKNIRNYKTWKHI